MLFKTSELRAQFRDIHPDVRSTLIVLDAQLESWKLPPLTVTDGIRTIESQERIYKPTFLADGLSEEEAKRAARNKFSWHLCATACDFRSSGHPYSVEDEERVSSWLHRKCPGPMWELLLHDVGHGRHFHVARRDFGWRKRWQARGVA